MAYDAMASDGALNDLQARPVKRVVNVNGSWSTLDDQGRAHVLVSANSPIRRLIRAVGGAAAPRNSVNQAYAVGASPPCQWWNIPRNFSLFTLCVGREDWSILLDDKPYCV